ncbi:uncharacterized protein LOC111080077 [Drosophila obscura]|uniref:uncharacterized protein LOC111080077 n=1 Tax=Drosophila obscura TaxID=7282 RepID=UPI001BB257A6|nr:uncharacterized protein LOC111080077 [Drosophila obscura]
MSKSKVNPKGLSFSHPAVCRPRSTLTLSKKETTSQSYFGTFTHPLCPNHYVANPLDKPYYHEYLWKSCQQRMSSALRIKNRVDVEADSLGNTVGMVCSESKIACPRTVEGRQAADVDSRNFATYLKAFALVYVLPEVDWTADKIDMLLQEGTELFKASSEEDGSKKKASKKPPLLRPQIYTDAENRIKRNFTLEGHTFTLALESRYLGSPQQPLETQPRHIIKNLRVVLQTFFRTGHYCLLLTKQGHLLIWKRRKLFFVLDVQGRRKDDLVSDKAIGVAMLVCLQTIDNVFYMVSQLSGISPTDEFSLRELVVVRLVTPAGRIFLRDTVQREVDFEVINNNYAYLKGNLHLSLNTADPLRSRSSIMVAVGAIMASKIDHPATWNTNMFDRLICYGVELCRSCWGDRMKQPINLDEFPTQLRLGQFVVELELRPNVRAGNWRCVVRVAGTDFEHQVRETLKEYGNVIFQINSQMYAIWNKDDFYYLLDAYRHTIVGTHVQQDKAKGAKWSTVRMFRDPLTMISVFHQLLKESNRQSPYHLHAVRIKNMAECPKGYALAPLPEGVDPEVQSINDTIRFNRQATSSGHMLASLSDHEEDLVSQTEDTFDIEKFELLDDIKDDDDEKEHNFDEAGEEEEDTQDSSKENTKGKNDPPSPKNVSRLASGRSRNSSPPMSKPKPSSKVKDQRLTSGGPHKGLAPKEKPSGQTATSGKSQSQQRSVTSADRPHSFSMCSKPSGKQFKDLAKSMEEIRASRQFTPQICTSCESDARLSCPNKPIKVAQFQAKTFKQKGCQQSCWCSGRESIEASSKQAAIQEHKFPGFCRVPQMLAVAGSESGTVESLKRLFVSSFQAANRVLAMTPWGNYVVFRADQNSESGSGFLVFDGCTCNIDRFRHLDLSRGTEGLLPFDHLSQVVAHIIDSRELKALHALRSRLEAPCRRLENQLAHKPQYFAS